MTTKEITVADIIKFFQTIPPETKVRVKQEVQRNWETYTEYTNVVQYGDGEFKIKCPKNTLISNPILFPSCII